MTIAQPPILSFIDFINGIKNKRKHDIKKSLTEYLCNRGYSLALALWTAYNLKDNEIPIFKKMHFDLFYGKDTSTESLKEDLKIPPHKLKFILGEDSYYSLAIQLRKIYDDYDKELFLVKTMAPNGFKVLKLSLMTRQDFDKKLSTYQFNNSWYLDSDNHRNIIDDVPYVGLREIAVN
jgi:hypothetical protein